MSIFEDKLNSATIHEEIDAKILFESFLLKKIESPYSFINLTTDLDSISSDYIKDASRYICKRKEYTEVKTFIGIPYQKLHGDLYYICAKMDSENKVKLDIEVFGHDDYETLKKFATLFISKYPDISVHLKLEAPILEYIYPNVEKQNFFKIIKDIFFKVMHKIEKQ